MIISLLLLLACGDESEDTGSEDTGVSVNTTEEIGANFFCG